jgi:riboflavin kinase/FMN adenylyltransferase
MSLIRGWSDLDACRGGVVAIGNFDGVHRGHQAMIAELRRRADAAGTPAVAVTFEPPPVELLRPQAAPPRLMTLERKAECLRAAGADGVLAIPTDRELLALSAETFFGDILRGRLDIRGVVEGPNFRFGQGRKGDVELLRRLCEQSGLTCAVVPPVEVAGRMVSSSAVRDLILSADLPAAAELLGRPHEAIGVVARGAARGATLGFPTANVGGIATLLPPDGVYAGRTDVDGRLYAAAIHIGPNSTFGETTRTFEAHLLDFSGDLYGRTLRTELLAKVRDTVKFDGPAALVEQLRADCRRVRDLGGAGGRPL